MLTTASGLVRIVGFLVISLCNKRCLPWVKCYMFIMRHGVLHYARTRGHDRCLPQFPVVRCESYEPDTKNFLSNSKKHNTLAKTYRNIARFSLPSYVKIPEPTVLHYSLPVFYSESKPWRLLKICF